MSTSASNGKHGNGGATPGDTWAGAGRGGDGRIRVAIVGVGNCASSLLQGRYYYENAAKDDFSAGGITDAIRCLKLDSDRGPTGTLVAPSSYFMKSPLRKTHCDIAFDRVEAFIRGDDNKTLVGTEVPATRALKPIATGKAKAAAIR